LRLRDILSAPERFPLEKHDFFSRWEADFFNRIDPKRTLVAYT